MITPTETTTIHLLKTIHITRKKEQDREEDRLRLERGEVSPDQLQTQNSLIPMELAADPQWKAKRLASAAAAMNRSNPKLNLPTSLFQRRANTFEK